MKAGSPYARPLLGALVARLREDRRFLQVLAGPRQSGKTTLIRQAVEVLGVPSAYRSADEATLRGPGWIAEQWDLARIAARHAGRAGALLVLDEVQKVSGWPEAVKRLWDEDSAGRLPLKVVVLASAPLLVEKGLGESLAGRFELIRVPHWSFAEMRDAFGFDLDRYLFFGGYPGAASLVADPERWARYLRDSLIETTISRDVLLLSRVDKPALLRRLFQLACDYTGQVVSYQKMVGQLQDAGNTTTLSHYLHLLAGAGMAVGLQKFAGGRVRQRASSPKLQVLNTALASATSPLGFEAARRDRASWGRLVESAVGAHLVNGTAGSPIEVLYWREGSKEVDFVLRRGAAAVAIEVKSGRSPGRLPGMDAFVRAFPRSRSLVVGSGGVALEEFLLAPPEAWLGA